MLLYYLTGLRESRQVGGESVCIVGLHGVGICPALVDTNRLIKAFELPRKSTPDTGPVYLSMLRTDSKV